MNPKANNNRQRTSGNKSPLPRILIVCEGEKTEYNYFDYIIDKFKLTSTVFVKHSSGKTSAKQILYKAISSFNKENRNFQEVYLVYDRDRKHDFEKITNYVSNCQLVNVKTSLIISIPSVEIWFLLHYFDGTHNNFRSNQKGQAKYKTANDLKEILGKQYNQGNLSNLNNRYEWLLNNFQSAQDRALNLRVPNYNPLDYDGEIFTNMDELVSKLIL